MTLLVILASALALTRTLQTTNVVEMAEMTLVGTITRL
jgi:hypothetical protein